MSIKTILLHLNNDPQLESRIEIALNLAARHDAHIKALFTIAQVTVPTSFMGYVPPEFIEQSKIAEKKEAEDAKAKLEKLSAAAGRQIEVIIEEGYAPDLISAYAVAVDLIIIGQGDPEADNKAQSQYIADELVVSSPRPVLVIPFVGNYENFGKHIIVAWNNSRESSRALHEALPFLTEAEKVTLLSVNANDVDSFETEHVLAHLKRHGINANFKAGIWPDLKVGDALLDALVDHGADMLVMGAYGHSRIREMILGGATENILAHMTAPVLFAH
jgi:nucleotide-binding universal stress UspA family protein